MYTYIYILYIYMELTIIGLANLQYPSSYLAIINSLSSLVCNLSDNNFLLVALDWQDNKCESEGTDVEGVCMFVLANIS